MEFISQHLRRSFLLKDFQILYSMELYSTLKFLLIQVSMDICQDYFKALLQVLFLNGNHMKMENLAYSLEVFFMGYRLLIWKRLRGTISQLQTQKAVCSFPHLEVCGLQKRVVFLFHCKNLYL